MSVKANGLQRSLTFLLPPSLFRLLESWVIGLALPQEGQSRRCFVFPVLTLRALGTLPLTTSFPYSDLRLFNMRSGTQESCLWGGINTREWGLALAPDPKGVKLAAMLSACDGFDSQMLQKHWWLEGEKT